MEQEIHQEIKNLHDNKNNLRRDMEKNKEELRGKPKNIFTWPQLCFFKWSLKVKAIIYFVP